MRRGCRSKRDQEGVVVARRAMTNNRRRGVPKKRRGEQNPIEARQLVTPLPGEGARRGVVVAERVDVMGEDGGEGGMAGVVCGSRGHGEGVAVESGMGSEVEVPSQDDRESCSRQGWAKGVPQEGLPRRQTRRRPVGVGECKSVAAPADVKQQKTAAGRGARRGDAEVGAGPHKHRHTVVLVVDGSVVSPVRGVGRYVQGLCSLQ
jgi:hypothetical protein